MRRTPARARHGRLARLLAALWLTLATGAGAETLTLPKLVERARANDLRVRESQAQLEILKAQYRQAQWAWFPRFDSYVAIAGPTPEARNDGLGGPPTTAATRMYDLDFGQPGATFRAAVDAVIPIYTFGKLDAIEEAGRQGVELGEALTERSRDEAEFQVAQAYYALVFARAGRDVVDDALKRLADAQKTLSTLRAQQSDQVTQMDEFKLSFYREQGLTQLAAAKSGEAVALAAIRLLIGAKPGEQVEVAVTPLEAPQGSLDPIDAYVELARQHRPELMAVEAGIAARRQEVALREAMFFPDLGIAGFFRWAWTTSATRQYSPFAYDPYNDLSAGVGLVVRYQWDFPVKMGVLDQARGEVRKLEVQRDLLLGAVRLEIEKAWNDTVEARERGDRQQAAEREARRWATSAFASFELGTTDTRDLVDSFSALALVSAARYRAWHDGQVSLRALNRAVGTSVHLRVEEPPAPEPTPGLVPAP